VLNSSYRALRLPIRPVVESWKGSGATEGLLSREEAHFLGWDRLYRMRGCELRNVVGIGTFAYVLLRWLDLSLV